MLKCGGEPLRERLVRRPLGRWQRGGDGCHGPNAAFLGSLVSHSQGDLDQAIRTGRIQERPQHRLTVAEDQALDLVRGQRPRRHGPRELDYRIHSRAIALAALPPVPQAFSLLWLAPSITGSEARSADPR